MFYLFEYIYFIVSSSNIIIYITFNFNLCIPYDICIIFLLCYNKILKYMKMLISLYFIKFSFTVVAFYEFSLNNEMNILYIYSFLGIYIYI